MCDEIVGRAARAEQGIAVGSIDTDLGTAVDACKRGEGAGAGIEIGVIQQIEEIQTELDRDQFVYLPVLIHRKIGGYEIGASAVSAGSHVRGQCADLIADQSKRVRVDDL